MAEQDDTGFFGKNSVRKSGLLDRVEKSLTEAGMEYKEYGAQSQTQHFLTQRKVSGKL